MKTKDFQILLREIVRETIGLLKEAQHGEWWIQGGQAIFADGDVGDSGHEGYVIEALSREIYEHFIGNVSEIGYLSEHEDELFNALKHEGRLTEKDIHTWTQGAGPTEVLVKYLLKDKIYKNKQQAWDAVFIAWGSNSKDARDYAMQYLGWKRLDQNGKYLAVQTWFLRQEDLDDIKRGIWDALSGEEPEAEEDEEGNEIVPDYDVEIEIMSSHRHFKDIPLEVLGKAEVRSLIPYLHRSFQMREKKRVAPVMDPMNFTPVV